MSPHSPQPEGSPFTPRPIPEGLDGATTPASAQAFAEALGFGEAPDAGDLRIPTLPNLRDLGGWGTPEGRTVRRGVLYRSVAPNRLDEAGLSAFADLGIRTVYDLRTAAEQAAAPDRVPDGVVVIGLDVLAGAEQAAPAHLTDLFSDPAGVNEALGNGRAEELFLSAYRGFVNLPSARDAYSTLYAGIAENANRPALIHCTTGKDRTGWAAAALLTWLGVPADDVLAEYLRTTELLRPALDSVYDRFAAAGGDVEILDAILGVRERYLAAAFHEMHKVYGSIDDYVTEGLELTEAQQAALRAALLD